MPKIDDLNRVALEEKRRDGRAEEIEAVARIREGHADALGVLVRLHEERALRVAYLIVGDRGVALDVVQDAFVRAYERIELFDMGRPFAPWFMRIVMNGSITAASRRRRRGAREVSLETLGDGQLPGEPDHREPGPDELAEQADFKRRVFGILDGLPPTQRAAVVQRYYLGMSEAEMAEDAGVPSGTIKWRLHAARRRLSRVLRPPHPITKAPADVVAPGAGTLPGNRCPLEREEGDERP